VDEVDLEVRAGEIVGIIGPNGAGKTTLLDLLAGSLRADCGQVVLGDEDVTDLDAAARAERGVARSFQDARLFRGLTVEENLAVALERFLVSRDLIAAALRLPASVLSEALAARQVETLVAALGLGAFGDKVASELSTGSRRVVELGSLVAQQGEVMLLDEPGAGLAQRETEAMAPLLRRLRDATGAALVVVEHDVPLLLAACDRLVAMELGRVIADGPPADVVADPAVVASYLGTRDVAVARSGSARPRASRRGPLRAQPRGASTGRRTTSK
jgi:branched-chain amino acid transport system ATP-binding protein